MIVLVKCVLFDDNFDNVFVWRLVDKVILGLFFLIGYWIDLCLYIGILICGNVKGIVLILKLIIMILGDIIELMV